MTEADVINLIRYEATQRGYRLWRNNVGACHTPTGFIRFGLANESTQINAVIKSGDLIGIKPILITTRHVGRVIGQFISRECKRPGWRYAGTPRELAQIAWAELILSLGGDAAIITGVGSL
jgi:hypothetical protein